MQERAGDYYENREMASSIKRYESLRKAGVFAYFDVEEFENIVNFYIDNNQLKKAQGACLSGLSIHPTASELKLKNAQLYVALGNPNEAIQWLAKVNELNDHSHEFHLTKGMAMVLLGLMEKAEAHFDRALAISILDEKEDTLYNIGEALENSGNFYLAIKYYQLGNKHFPDNEEFLFRLGFCFDRMAEFDQSIAAYQRYLDFNPFSENVWYNIGIIYNKIEQFNNAVEAYDYAIALDGTHYDALFNKANSLANAEKHHEAIQTYKEYLSIYENSLTALYYIGECYIQLKDYDAALQNFDAILKENKDFSEAYYGKALVYDELEQFDAAIVNYKKTIELDGENTDAWFSLGNLYNKLERDQDALEAYEQTLKQNKFDIEAWLAYAKTYFILGKTVDSIRIINEAIDYMPDYSELLYALSAYYLAGDDLDSGLKWFANAYKIDSENFNQVFEIYPKAKDLAEIQQIINT
ncbi:MAG: tetratricopeptide repeat protein [Salinivirgaceae bacterium]